MQKLLTHKEIEYEIGFYHQRTNNEGYKELSLTHC